ncbi:MAG TPA: hypothetical protein VFP97_13655 [Chitinophagaceae bacterium]|nr:hypothetical protein [Chitinophagaceae bacterium]
MISNSTLDDMILQYSESPFSEEKIPTDSGVQDRTQKQRMLSKLLLIAGNLFEKYPESNPGFYKRRYEFNA